MILLVFAALDVGMGWLAALFVLGPLYRVWRWPETIAIDELLIFQSAWYHQELAVEEIASIEVSKISRYVGAKGSHTGPPLKFNDPFE